MIKFLRERWFLILLIVVLVVGIGAGTRLKSFADRKAIRDSVVAAVLFLMALPLEPRTIWRTIRRPWASVLAVLVSYGLLPLIAWPISFLLQGGLGPGLLVAATTPTTVASAAVWTRKAGGNDAIATMVTVMTNMMCFVAMPIWLSAMMGHGIQSEEFEFGRSVTQLGKLVVLPMITAQIVRLYVPLARWASQHTMSLSMLAQCGILYMVFTGAIQTGMTLFGQNASPPHVLHLAVMLVVVVGIHVAMFWVGYGLAGLTGLSRGDQIAVGFAGSQKTLMIGLKVALDYGVSILPMVTFHVGQLLVDTVIADRLRRASDLAARQAAGQAAGQAEPPSDLPAEPPAVGPNAKSPSDVP